MYKYSKKNRLKKNNHKKNKNKKSKTRKNTSNQDRKINTKKSHINNKLIKYSNKFGGNFNDVFSYFSRNIPSMNNLLASLEYIGFKSRCSVYLNPDLADFSYFGPFMILGHLASKYIINILLFPIDYKYIINFIKDSQITNILKPIIEYYLGLKDLTGSPIDNGYDEIRSQIHILIPDLPPHKDISEYLIDISDTDELIYIVNKFKNADIWKDLTYIDFIQYVWIELSNSTLTKAGLIDFFMECINFDFNELIPTQDIAKFILGPTIQANIVIPGQYWQDTIVKMLSLIVEKFKAFIGMILGAPADLNEFIFIIFGWTLGKSLSDVVLDTVSKWYNETIKGCREGFKMVVEVILKDTKKLSKYDGDIYSIIYKKMYEIKESIEKSYTDLDNLNFITTIINSISFILKLGLGVISTPLESHLACLITNVLYLIYQIFKLDKIFEQTDIFKYLNSYISSSVKQVPKLINPSNKSPSIYNNYSSAVNTASNPYNIPNLNRPSILSQPILKYPKVNHTQKYESPAVYDMGLQPDDMGPQPDDMGPQPDDVDG